MEVENKCPICGKPIPKKRYGMVTCGSWVCVTTQRSHTLKEMHKNGQRFGPFASVYFDKIRSAIDDYFRTIPPFIPPPICISRYDVEDWFEEQHLFRDLKPTALAKVITTILSHGTIRIGGRYTYRINHSQISGKKNPKFFRVDLLEEGMEADAIASDS